ncbi:MAG: hypothetical protein IH596_02280 [Bacteroidales bacterium]|nr:hypothetical protein [Bacteroidales bacterium]
MDDDYSTGMVLLQNGNLVISGTTMDSNTLQTDGILICIDSLGNIIWINRFGESYPNDNPASITESAYHNLLGGGNLGSFAFLGKWDLNGNKLWTKTIHTSPGIKSVVSTADSAYAFSGNAYYQIIVCKTDTSGEVLWQTNLGGPDYEHYTSGTCLIQNQTGGYTVCGTKTLYPHPGRAGYVAGLKPDGSFFWNQMHGELEHTQVARQIKQVADRSYFYCGSHSTSYMVPTIWDGIFVKTNSGGQVIWSKLFCGPGDDYFNAFDTTGDGGFILCGKTTSFGAGQSDVWLVRTDANGDTLWTRTFGGPYDEEAVSVITMPDGGFFICGYTNSYWNYGFDILLIRTDRNGEVQYPPGDRQLPRRIPLDAKLDSQ